MDFPRPKPTIHHDNYVFWEGCKQHKLMIQKCGNCGTLQHPPRPMCSNCNSLEKDYVEASGKGEVHSFFIGERSLHPLFPPGFNMVLIDLEEGVRIVATIVDAEPDQIDFGTKVTLDFIDEDDWSLPVFRLAE